jgi:hypothetical protein
LNVQLEAVAALPYKTETCGQVQRPTGLTMAPGTELSTSLAGFEALVFQFLSWMTYDTLLLLLLLLLLILIIIIITHLNVLLENCNFRKFE